MGQGFYQFVVSLVSSIIATMDRKSGVISNKRSIINQYAIKYNLPNATHKKILTFFGKDVRVDEQEWKLLFSELPQALQSDIMNQTYGKIISEIQFFKDKSKDFQMAIIPEMKGTHFFADDILFNQDDLAEELYFIFRGTVVCLIDISDFVDMSLFISGEQCFNISFISFDSGTYLGDNDALLNRQGQRSHTSVCETNCNIYYLKKTKLEVILSLFPTIKQQMWDIARQKDEYFKILKQEIKLKYAKNHVLEQLYEQLKDEEWTEYMSLKRKMNKFARCKKFGRKNAIAKDTLEDQKELKEIKRTKKKKISENKPLAKLLGKKAIGGTHIETYPENLKKIINVIADNRTKF